MDVKKLVGWVRKNGELDVPTGSASGLSSRHFQCPPHLVPRIGKNIPNGDKSIEIHCLSFNCSSRYELTTAAAKHARASGHDGPFMMH
jgi:hypothetical protein